MRKTFFIAIALFCIFAFLILSVIEIDLVANATGGIVLSNTKHGACLTFDSIDGLKHLAFKEVYREVVEGETYVYGVTPFSHKFICEDFGQYNCQILIKQTGEVRVGLPLIYTSSTIS